MFVSLESNWNTDWMICVESHLFFRSNFWNFLAHKIYYSHLKTLTLNNCGETKNAGKVLYPGARKGWVANRNRGRSTPRERDPLPIVQEAGVRGRSGWVRKSSPPLEFGPRTAQQVTGRYSYYAVPAA